MDRLSAHIVATALLTAAFAVVPIALEQSTAGSAAARTGSGTESGTESASLPGNVPVRRAGPTGSARNARSAPRTAAEAFAAALTEGTSNKHTIIGAEDAGPGVGPDPNASTDTTAGSTGSSSPSVSAPASAPASGSPTAPPTDGTLCSDAYQIGQTAYAQWHGMDAFTLQQYYSPTCHTRYGLAEPTPQFEALDVSYDLGMAVFDVTNDAIDGPVTFVGDQGGPQFWSAPVTVPAGTCTEGLVHVFYPDDETDTYTDKACF